MYRASRLLAPAGTHSEATESVTVDVGLLFLRLLLFEEFVIQSMYLREVPALLRELGYGQTKALLTSGLVKFLMDATGIGQIGQTDFLLEPRGGRILPPGSYAFARLRQGPEIIVPPCMRSIEEMDGIGRRKKLNILSAVKDCIVTTQDDFGNDALDQLKKSLARNDPSARMAVLVHLERQGIQFADRDKFELHLHQLSDFGDVRAEIGTGSLYLDAESQHQAIEKGLMAVARLEMDLQYMRDFEAVTGFQFREVPVLDGRVAFFSHDLAPEAHEASWRRVIEVTGLPDIRKDPGLRRVDIDKVIDLAKSKECREFRTWLRTSDRLSPDEIRGVYSGLLAGASLLSQSGPGRTVRFAVSNLANWPAPIGLVVGGLDSFLIDKLLPESGPVTFLGSSYPSLFRDWLPPSHGKPLIYP